jgi:hypothetical protein
MFKKDLTLKDINKKVKKETETHHIFSDFDQTQLADIIKQLGNKDNSNVIAKKPKKIIDKNQPKNKLPIKQNVSDQEIVWLLDKIAQFTPEKIQQEQFLYNIYLDKLQSYKELVNFKKIIKQEEYFSMIISHLNHLSRKIIAEQKSLENNMQSLNK